MLRKFQDGFLPLPSEIRPRDPQTVNCKHGYKFIGKEVKLFSEVTIYTESSERKESMTIYGVETGLCRCLLQPDTTTHLLWNIGNAHLICFRYLMSLVHSFCNGVNLNQQFDSRNSSFINSLDRITSLTKLELRRSTIGMYICMF